MNDRYRPFRQAVLFLGLFCLVTATVFAAEPSRSVSKSSKVSSKTTIDPQLLFRYVATLASDELKGRDPAGEGGILAARYLKTKFKTLGLKPGGDRGTYIQKFMASRWQGIPSDAPISPASSSKDAVGGSAASVSPREAKVQAKGLPDLPDLKSLELQAEQKASARKISHQIQDLFGSGGTDSGYANLSEESIRRVELTREMRANYCMNYASRYVMYWCRRHANTLLRYRDFPCRNVLAMLPGTDPKLAKEVIVVSAHYDHVGIWQGDVYNGADDNASGTTALLELARVLKARGTRRSILFIAFDAEEKGLWGSRNWVRYPTVPLENVVAQINFDMIGRMQDDELYVLGTNSSKELADLIVKEFDKEKVTTYSIDACPHADHWPFFQSRIPSVTFCDGMHHDYHLPTDDAEKIDIGEMEQVIRIALESIRRLDARSERVKFSAE